MLRQALLHSSGTAENKALSIAVGIFCGLSPFWGFHTALAIAASIIFRLNKPLTIIASNISIPPLIPFVIYAGHEFGALFMGNNAVHINFNQKITPEVVARSSIQYLAGGLVLALAGGLLSGAIAYAVFAIRKTKTTIKS